MLTRLIDYNYYSKIYGGSSIPESSFNKYSTKSSSQINLFTSNRITDDNITESIKNAVCEVAELIYNQEMLVNKIEDDTKEVASETVGPHSKSYVNKSNLKSQRILTKEELNKECYRICYTYISNTGLMFRG